MIYKINFFLINVPVLSMANEELLINEREVRIEEHHLREGHNTIRYLFFLFILLIIMSVVSFKECIEFPDSNICSNNSNLSVGTQN